VIVALGHNDTHLVGLPWTSDGPVAEVSTRATHYNYNRQTSMPPGGFETAVSASERL